jgi:hypothetical protein
VPPAKGNPRADSEKDNNDGDLGMSKNQAARKLAQPPSKDELCPQTRRFNAGF